MLKQQSVLTGHNASIFALSPAEDDQFFFSSAGDGWIVRWDLDQPEMGKLVAKVDSQVFSLLFLPEWNRVVAGNMNGGLHWVELDQPDQTRNIAHHQKGVFRIRRVGPYVYTCGGDGILTRWDPEQVRSLESIQLSHLSLRAFAHSPERGEMAIGASDGNIYLLDEDLNLKATITNAHANSVFCLAFSPGGEYLLSGGRDAHLKVWESTGLSNVASQAAHWFTLNDLVFHPNGSVFASASRDKTIKIWDAQTFQLLKVLDTIRDKGHVNSVNALLWTKSENRLISASDDRSIMVWHRT
jgi:WD40 repeat protein